MALSFVGPTDGWLAVGPVETGTAGLERMHVQEDERRLPRCRLERAVEEGEHSRRHLPVLFARHRDIEPDEPYAVDALGKVQRSLLRPRSFGKGGAHFLAPVRIAGHHEDGACHRLERVAHQRITLLVRLVGDIT